MRGDDGVRNGRRNPQNGRPPRARGRRTTGPAARRRLGTTPACAGTTRCAASATPGTWDDPRVRGDDSATSGRAKHVIGRPPRARGRPSTAVASGHVERTTPACAGTTSSHAEICEHPEDDPRVRGDDWGCALAGADRTGRPPRARGRRPVPGRPDRARGTTPACAGTTAVGDGSGSAGEDDPRVRGDDRFMRAMTPPHSGRPPRARGRRSGWTSSSGRRRTTPACAGTTGGRWWLGVGSWDDPRVRGDDSTAGTDTAAAWGRPPRARGRRRAATRF